MPLVYEHLRDLWQGTKCANDLMPNSYSVITGQFKEIKTKCLVHLTILKQYSKKSYHDYPGNTYDKLKHVEHNGYSFSIKNIKRTALTIIFTTVYYFKTLHNNGHKLDYFFHKQ